MQTGFNVENHWFHLQFTFRIGGRRGLFASIRALLRWFQATIGVRYLGMRPPARPVIHCAKVESLDEGFERFRERRGALPPPERPAPKPRPRRPRRESYPRHRPDIGLAAAQRKRRPSDVGELDDDVEQTYFGVTTSQANRIRGETRRWRQDVEIEG